MKCLPWTLVSSESLLFSIPATMTYRIKAEAMTPARMHDMTPHQKALVYETPACPSNRPLYMDRLTTAIIVWEGWNILQRQ
jgi:hypothetical protein